MADPRVDTSPAHDADGRAPAMNGRVLSRAEMARAAEEARAAGKTVVFTNGCFDLLHVGHIRYLRSAREQGDLLFVGINSDRSVQRLKGPGRPLMPEEERAEMLAALRSVDAVSIFDEDGSEALIEAVRPQIHTKGGDYTEDQVPEAPLVRSLGGDVRIMPLAPGRSTSRLIRLLRGEETAGE